MGDVQSPVVGDESPETDEVVHVSSGADPGAGVSDPRR